MGKRKLRKSTKGRSRSGHLAMVVVVPQCQLVREASKGSKGKGGKVRTLVGRWRIKQNDWQTILARVCHANPSRAQKIPIRARGGKARVQLQARK